MTPLEKAYLRRLNETLEDMLSWPATDATGFLRAAMRHFDAMSAAYHHCLLHGPIEGTLARMEARDGRLVTMFGDAEADGMEAVREAIATWREPSCN